MNKIITEKALEIKEGKTYWISVGDNDFFPNKEMVENIFKSLKDKHPKTKFIVCPYFIKPVTEKKTKVIKNERCK